MHRGTRVLFAVSLSSFALACSTRAGDAGEFWESSAKNQCYILKKCSKYYWNDQEYKNIEDCVDDILDEISADDFDDVCMDYDEDKAKDCLNQQIGEYNSCTPAHDYDDADFDSQDDPCNEVCGGSVGFQPVHPWLPDEQR